MRTIAVGALILLASVACDKEDRTQKLVESVVGDDQDPFAAASAAAKPAPAPDAAATDDAATDAGADAADAVADAGAPKMPERPIPKPQTMVLSSAPQETQMKAIAYMVAMRSPRLEDPQPDEDFARDLVDKLKPVVLAMDKGPNKAKLNGVEMVAAGRQIDVLLSEGCHEKTPFNVVVQRVNTPLSKLHAHGVLVVRCNDSKRQCLQSTRDADDILCTTAPRRAR